MNQDEEFIKVPKPRLRLWLLIVFLIVFFLGAGVFGWYFKNNKKSPSNKIVNTVEETNTNSSTKKTETKEVISTADWKTYTNDKLGFSFKYPSDYLTEKDKLSGVGGENNLIIKEKNGYPKLYLWVNADGFGPFFPDITYEIAKKDQYIEILKRNIEPKNENNNDGITFISTLATKVEANNYIFHFKYNEKDDFENIFKEILESFKFTTPAANENLYANQLNSYQIQLPEGWTATKAEVQTGERTDFKNKEGKTIFIIESPLPERGFEGHEISKTEKIIATDKTELTKKLLKSFDGQSSDLIIISWDNGKGKSGMATMGIQGETDPNIKIVEDIFKTFKLL